MYAKLWLVDSPVFKFMHVGWRSGVLLMKQDERYVDITTELMLQVCMYTDATNEI